VIIKRKNIKPLILKAESSLIINVYSPSFSHFNVLKESTNPLMYLLKNPLINPLPKKMYQYLTDFSEGISTHMGKSQT
jgi:hypothetical protein